MKKGIRCLSLFWTVLFLLSTLAITAQAAPTIVSPSPAPFGEIERITIKDAADVYSAGVMVVGGVEMIIPKNLLIDLPANRLSLQQIFAQAPAACKALGESGLAKADRCNGTGSGGIATLSAVRTNAGNVIIGDLFIMKAGESVVGVVTYINYTDGYYRVNGITNDPNTGVMVRLNDPTSRHTIQSGAGCIAGSPNCSPDPRFTLDPDNYTNNFATGYPVCIPSTVLRSFTNIIGGPSTSQASATGTGDYLCPDTNRSPLQLNEPAVADSRRFAPVMVGDSVTAEGNYETIGGVRFLSAHTTNVQKALGTRNVAGQPDYLFLAEVGTEAPGFQNQRLVNLVIGFATLAPTDVDIWSIHRDPVSNLMHEFPFASVLGCDNSGGGPGTCSAQGLGNAGANIFKINYKVDFAKGADPKLSPCAHLLASRFATSNPGICTGGATTKNDFAVLSPIPHEIIARTGRKITSPAGSLITIDVNGNQATNGEYLFPLGLNLGGLGVAEMSEIDLNLLNTPVIFEGFPWNLDRRLGPAGCLNAGGCEAGTVGSAAFALDPFPFSGLDPRAQASLLPTGTYSNTGFTSTPLTDVRNRIFSYVSGTPLAGGKFNFNGNTTVLPYVLGTFPADPALIPILPTPLLSVFPPIAIDDTVTAVAGVSVAIDVIANDVPVLGAIDPLSVQVVTNPASGSVAVNPTTGAITFTPANPLISTVSFTYTVANNFGSVSAPATVTVTSNVPATAPVANNDSAPAPALSAVNINVLTNDTATIPAIINPASLAVSAATGGTAVANIDGTVTYTAPGVPGTYSFSYTVKDNAVTPLTSDTATVTVTVSASAQPVAIADAATTIAVTPVVINVLANDTAASIINPASLAISTQSINGIATANVNGTVTFTPAAGFSGTTTFAYTFIDNLLQTSNAAIVTVTVATQAPLAVADAATMVAGAPPVVINVTLNDTVVSPSIIDIATVIISTPSINGTAVANVDGTVTFTPAAGFGGTTTFAYTVKNTLGQVSNPAIVTITVTGIVPPVTNFAPVAVSDVASTFVNTPRIINLTANDTDADGTINPATVVIVNQPLNASVFTNNLNGTVTYTSAIAGTDSFTYTVTDNLGLISTPATVTVSVASAITDSVNVLRAQFTTATRQWSVEGTTTNVSPLSKTVTIYVGNTPDALKILGTVNTNAADGRWKFQLPGAPGNLGPAPANTISVALPSTASRLAFPVAVR